MNQNKEEKTTTKLSYFSCISSWWQCDMEPDCPGADDELNCGKMISDVFLIIMLTCPCNEDLLTPHFYIP